VPDPKYMPVSMLEVLAMWHKLEVLKYINIDKLMAGRLFHFPSN